MKKRRATRVLALLLLCVLAVVFGWTPRDRSWQAASGWDQLSPALQPPGGLSDHLFSDTGPTPSIHWLGHSGFWIEWAGQSILLDPNFQKRVTLSARFIDPPTLPADQAFDAVCISHAHFDHMSPATLKPLSSIGQIIVPSKSEGYLEMPLPGAPGITGLVEWASTTVGPLTVTAVPAKHNGCRYHPWGSRYIALGYVISDGKRALYFAGDTAYQGEVFAQIRERLHPQTAILPIGCYAPRIPFKIHHIDPREAVLAAIELDVTRVIPCHFGTYRLTLDAPSTALPRFAEEASLQKIFWSMPPYYEAGP